MSETRLFRDLRLNGKPLNECELALEAAKSNYRLYVDKAPDKHAFRAMAVEFNSCQSEGDIWQCQELEVTPLFNCTAYYDGVRHLEFNRDDKDFAGYIYYPNMQGLVDLMAKVREIELEICPCCAEQANEVS
jgi:hypothetical protein